MVAMRCRCRFNGLPVVDDRILHTFLVVDFADYFVDSSVLSDIVVFGWVMKVVGEFSFWLCVPWVHVVWWGLL